MGYWLELKRSFLLGRSFEARVNYLEVGDVS